MRKMEIKGRSPVEKRQVLCLLLGIAAAFLSYFVDKQSSPLQEGFRLERGSYGQGERRQELLVDGLGEQTVTVELGIGERKYSKEEAEAVLAEVQQELEVQMLGENPSLQEVRSRLNLPAWLEETGIRVEWEAEDPDLIGADGEIHSAQCPQSGRKTVLTARLTAGETVREISYPLVIFPPEQTGEEALQERFLEALRKQDEAQKTSASLLLPQEYEGKRLSYHVRGNSDALLFLCLGAGSAFLLPRLEQEKQKEKRKKMERQMMLDYPEILSKLAVYSGAGLPIRASWERIVREYERTQKEQGKEEKGRRRLGGKTGEALPHAAYEEMAVSYYQMQRGIPERRAYAEFGERCHLMPYRKLSGLLEQNIQKGSRQLRPLLEAEMEDAFEQKKALARRMGEEASTKLLLPLFLMLFIVMVMVSVPAFLSFGL